MLAAFMLALTSDPHMAVHMSAVAAWVPA
jgi:hypothetical protein